MAAIFNRHGSKSLKEKFAKYDFVQTYSQQKSQLFIEHIKRTSHNYKCHQPDEISAEILIYVLSWGIMDAGSRKAFCNWKDDYHWKELNDSECKAMAYLIAENIIANVKAILPIDESHLNPTFTISKQWDDSRAGELRITYKAKSAKYIEPQAWK